MSMGWVHLDVERVVRATAQAFLLQLRGEDRRRVWVPRSQVCDPDDYAEGDEDCTVSVTDWFAEKEGLE